MLRVVLRPPVKGVVAHDAIDGFVAEHLVTAADRSAVGEAIGGVVDLLLARSGEDDAVEIVMDVGAQDVQMTGSVRGNSRGLGDAEVWFSVPLPG